MSKTSMNPSQAQTLRRDATFAARRADQDHHDLAEYLYKTSWLTVTKNGTTMPLYRHWGFVSWKQYVENELQLSHSRALRLRHVYSVFEVELKDKWDRSLALPFSKMEVLSRVVREDTVESLLRQAKNIPCDDLKLRLSGKARTSVKTLRSTGGVAQFNVGVVTRNELKLIEDAVKFQRQQTPHLSRRGALLAAFLRRALPALKELPAPNARKTSTRQLPRAKAA